MHRLTLLSLLLGTTSAFAAGNNELVVVADLKIEQVTVTASRVPVVLNTAGSAVTVLTGEQLEARQVRTIFDALRDVPGVEVSRTGSVGSVSQARIRGAEAGQALVMIDGVRANDPGQSSEEFNFAHLLSDSIERVEVLRGPQSALWGSDALSGVINVVTLAPQDGIFGRASAEYGSFNSKQVSGLLNAGTDRYGAVVHASWMDTDGANISRTGNEDDGYRNFGIGGRARAEIAPGFNLNVSLHHVDARTDSEATDFSSVYSIPLDSGDYTKFAATYGRAEARWLSDSQNIEVIAGASLLRSEAKDYTSAFGAPFDVAFNDRTKGGDTRFDVQGNFRWEAPTTQQRVSLLAETHRETFDTIRLDSPGANQNQHEVHSGVAGEYWIGIDDRYFISLGARHDWNERFDDSTTWRATVSGLVADGWRAHASAGTGVKNPDFYEMFGFFPSPAFEGNPELKPEKSFGWDVGLEWSASERFKLDVTYFHADLEDEIFTDFSVFPTTAGNADGRSKRSGVEVSAQAMLADGLTLDAAYTYLDSTEDGVAEIRRPHNIASADLNWRFADDRALLNLGVDYHGEQRDTAFLNAFPFSQPVTLGSYTLVRVAGSYDISDNFTLYGRVENALDEKYEEVFGYRTRGIGVFGGIRARFN